MMISLDLRKAVRLCWWKLSSFFTFSVRPGQTLPSRFNNCSQRTFLIASQIFEISRWLPGSLKRSRWSSCSGERKFRTNYAENHLWSHLTQTVLHDFFRTWRSYINEKTLRLIACRRNLIKKVLDETLLKKFLFLPFSVVADEKPF